MDPLRAGHVAVIEGRGFHYFCEAACKQEYLRANGRLPQEDVPTAAPPEVMYTGPATERQPRREFRSTRPTLPSVGILQGVGEEGGEVDAPASRIVDAPASRMVDAPAVDQPASFPGVARPYASDAPPSHVTARPPAASRTSGLPAPRVAPAAPPASPVIDLDVAARVTAIVDGLGIVAGVFVPAIGLLGAVAEVARIPLAIVAWAALAVRVQRAGRDASDPHPVVVLGPAAGAVIAACWAKVASDPHAVAIAVFAGLASAVSIAVEATVTRSRARVQAERRRIERALDARVRAIQGDEALDLPASDVRAGEPIVVEAGELVGVDAIVAAGEARVIPWLGATIETVKRDGEPLVAGARVVSSRLRLTTTWSGRERAWVRLLSVPAARVDVAAPTARLLRHTVERGVPVAGLVVGVAAVASNATSVQVLAAACAGAMAFAARSVVSFAALHFARGHLEALGGGITYKDARAFERAGSVNVAVLSARGTVLLGEPEIVQIEPIGSTKSARGARLQVEESAKATRQQADELPPPSDFEGPDGEVARVLSLAAGAETASTHPFAATILRAARARALKPDPVRNATAHAGLGVTALASTGERLVVGGRAIMLAEKIGVAVVDARVTELEAQGRSVLLVALGDRLVGLIALQDGLCAGARGAVQRLLDARIEPVLLSGEARDTCETIGRALDIEHVRPAVLPADRGPEVRALAEGGSVVAVVGHPASDDGALGAADVSIAMGAAGSTPGEWSVALASDDVRDAALALAIPHAARARARLAVTLGATPSLVALLAVFFGVAPLAVAPLAALLGAVAVAVHAREAARP